MDVFYKYGDLNWALKWPMQYMATASVGTNLRAYENQWTKCVKQLWLIVISKNHLVTTYLMLKNIPEVAVLQGLSGLLK